MIKLSSNELEAANRAEATALLIRAGFRVYRPEADVHGEDLLIRRPGEAPVSVQLKSRPWVDWKRYGRKAVWMLFPRPGFVLGRPWFLIEHDTLFDWFKQKHGHTPGWSEMWNTPSVSKELSAFLEPFSQAHWAAAGLSAAEPDEGEFPDESTGAKMKPLKA